jgi:tetratricopeptide (TPR) repeat protein
LGVARHESGALEEAVHAFITARDLFEAARDLPAMAACDQNLGAVLADAGRYDEARGRTEAARTTFASLGDERSTGECDHNLAMVLIALGREEAAAHFGNNALGAGVGQPSEALRRRPRD